ncbi:hypothetical protein AVEN_27147-1 [Araneus ventricosus]|uniref:Uncharacterized protein n=1 Tax=Araneus ventricosus TaxID=182803 RepID=A0A4Y2TC71_ARAVE|nr:hypothetical protein AVEN_27147-1 [Araneus ventricosus]
MRVLCKRLGVIWHVDFCFRESIRGILIGVNPLGQHIWCLRKYLVGTLQRNPVEVTRGHKRNDLDGWIQVGICTVSGGYRQQFSVSDGVTGIKEQRLATSDLQSGNMTRPLNRSRTTGELK